MHHQSERRSVYCRLLDDPEFQALSPEAQRTWFFLRFSSECGPIGLFRFYNEVTQARMKITTAALDAALSELEGGAWIGRESGWLFIRNAMRFEPGYTPDKNPKHLRHLHTHLSPLSHLKLAWDLLALEHLPIPSEWVSKGYRRPTGWVSEPLRIRVERESKRESKSESESDSSASLFPEAELESVKQVIGAFNKILGGKLGKVTEVSDARVRSTRARLREERRGLVAFKEYFESVLRCPFLLGKNNSEWRATFDWLMQPSNMAKVKDGNYKGRGPGAVKSTRDYMAGSRKVEVGE